MASLAGEAFAPFRLREGARPEEALAEVRVALARREVQLASLLDIIRQMEAEVQRAEAGRAVAEARARDADATIRQLKELVATTATLVADVARVAAAVQPAAPGEARDSGGAAPVAAPWLPRRMLSGAGALADAALRRVGLVRASAVQQPAAAVSPAAVPRVSRPPPQYVPPAPPPPRLSDGLEAPSASAALKASARGAALQLQLLAEASGAQTPLPRQGPQGHRRSSLPSYVGLGTYLAGGGAPRVSFADDAAHHAMTPASASASRSGGTPGSRSASPGGAFSRGFEQAWTPAPRRGVSPNARRSLPALPARRISGGGSAQRVRRSLAASPTPQ